MLEPEVQKAFVENLPGIITALGTLGLGGMVSSAFAWFNARKAARETVAGNAVLADVHASVKTITDQSMSGANAAATGAAVALAATDQQADRVAELSKRVAELEAENEKLLRGHRVRHDPGHTD